MTKPAYRSLLDEVDEQLRRTASKTGCAGFSPRVRAAMERVDRARFVRPADRASAFENRPLPIGHGQTISQPFIVALMTELLDLQPTDVVLEVGTGCGYQTAILAELARRVVTVEIVPVLAEAARARLSALGHANVDVYTGDGWAGWADASPYDGILVAAAAEETPTSLVAQLAPGGRLVVPVGAPAAVQDLVLIERDDCGVISEDVLLPVAFVPLVRGD